MPTRTLCGLVLIASAFAIVGCNGPTKTGVVNRAAANDRMNLISAQIHRDQAMQSFETGQFDKALREINHAIARYSKLADYHVIQGRIYLETHRLEQALRSFKTAIETDPKLPDPHYFCGIVFQRWSDDEQAYECYGKAYELEPTKAQYLMATAESLIAMGEFEAAKNVIQPKMAYFEHNAALRQLLGQIALLQGDPKNAAALYAEARLLNPDDDQLLEQLMWAQYAADMYGQCHESAKRLQQRCKTTRNELIHLEARCLTMMSRSVEARELYMQLTRLQPADPVIWSELGTLAWDLGDYRRVAMCSVQIIALAPDRYEGYMLKGINERQKSNIDEAIKLFRMASSRAPDTALPHLLLGQALEQSGNIKAAKVAYNDAASAEPESAEARELLRRLNGKQRITSVPPVENGKRITSVTPVEN